MLEKNALMRSLFSKSRTHAKSCIWDGITTCNSKAWALMREKALQTWS